MDSGLSGFFVHGYNGQVVVTAVVTAVCYELVKQSFRFRKIGKVALKNKESEVLLYEVPD
jgi:class 3 adenylate cyclase